MSQFCYEAVWTHLFTTVTWVSAAKLRDQLAYSHDHYVPLSQSQVKQACLYAYLLHPTTQVFKIWAATSSYVGV